MISEQEQTTETPAPGQASAEQETDISPTAEQASEPDQEPSSHGDPAPDGEAAPDPTPGEPAGGFEPEAVTTPEEADGGDEAAAADPTTGEPAGGSEPEAVTTPEEAEGADEEITAESEPDKPKVKPKAEPFPRPARRPSRASQYFVACPRCSYFLAGYKLIYQDFDDAADDASGDWVDLSWNLAVRNLVAKSYGYELAEPIQAVQGVCPDCRRAFSYQAADPDAEDESDGDRFSIQIKVRP